jgi:hypothetical protein
MFGGESGTTSSGYNTSLNDLWAFTGTNWTQVTTSGPAPSARSEAALAYDTATGGLVLNGGLTEGTSGQTNTESLASDTWTWQDGQWTNAAPGSHPPAAYDAGLAGSPLTGYQAILSGGFTGTDTLATTTYGWTGSTWVTNP